MKLSEMKRWLEAHDIKLTKSLGQNFLHDHNQLQRIAAAGELRPADQILEIGPGLGPLTDLLLDSGARVLAIEMDSRLVEFLRDKFASALAPPRASHEAASVPPRLELIHGDALAYVRRRRDWSGWKLVANLPYSVASPILVELAEAAAPPDRMVATLQIEVAQRIDAQPGTEHYGALGLLLGLRYESRGWFRIPASCFFPAPEIDSACLTLVRRPALLLPAPLEPAFTKIVKRGFSQRRKMMRKLLKADWPETRLDSAYAAAGLSPQIRAEKVSLPKFIELTQNLAAPNAE